jgi:hypothetical protein
MEKLKLVSIAVVVGLALTGLTYFYTSPVPLMAESDPFFWHYSVISVSESIGGSPAILRGFPFSYVLESDVVYIFGSFSFILNFILYLFVGSLLLWLLLRSHNEKIDDWFHIPHKKNVKPKKKKYNIK